MNGCLSKIALFLVASAAVGYLYDGLGDLTKSLVLVIGFVVCVLVLLSLANKATGGGRNPTRFDGVGQVAPDDGAHYPLNLEREGMPGYALEF